MSAPGAEHGRRCRGRWKSPGRGCLCSPAQVGGIPSRMLLSHPAACLVMPLGAAPLHAQVTFARKHEQIIPACLVPVEQRNIVGFAVQGRNKWSEMGRGGAPQQPLLCCLSSHPPALPNNSVKCKKLPSVAKSCSELQALEKGEETGSAQNESRPEMWPDQLWGCCPGQTR